ncbi:protein DETOXIFICATION 27-like [Cynara cardunculus var. scolymus]|uniref:protein DETOXIFICATION 27-like n=1 Tax=Cynara cardunculus var. scolymus TaxID=59895 RepID=UPI000D62CE74|nr:protein DETOXIFICATION 27-like [Cynara cardunculus var. scolymus]
MKNIAAEEGINHALLQSPPSTVAGDAKSKFWIESKKLWYIVGPSIFSRIASFTMNVVTQAFAGHLGDIELAAITISTSVIVGFNFGLLLGMASALETLCGQAFGAKRYNMIGIYMQRSWIVLFICCLITLPLYIFATPILKALGQPDDIAELSGKASLWLIPQHFTFALLFPMQRFLQSQLKTPVLAWVSLVNLVIHVLITWLFTSVFKFGLVGTVVALDISWWLNVVGLFVYTLFGGCPLTWNGFSMEAFSGLWEFVKLSAASGVMLCLENWYYRILILMTALVKNATIAVDAVSICMNINGWEMMIPLAFFAGIGVRVSNELGAGNGEKAKYATVVAILHSTAIGLVFCVLIMALHNKFALIFSSSTLVLEAVDHMAWLLAVTILLNSIQPVISGVAVGSGWQSWVAYINLGSYYLVGVPLGIVFGLVLHLGVEGIWGGMVFGGTLLQTIILGIITLRCDWEKEARKAVLKYSNLK